MNSANHLRLDVLATAIQEIARALAPAQAAGVADALSARVASMTAGALSEGQDEAAIVELVPLLDALGRGEMQQSAAERIKPAARVRVSGLLGYRSRTLRRTLSRRTLLLFMFPMAAAALSVGFPWRRISVTDPKMKFNCPVWRPHSGQPRRTPE